MNYERELRENIPKGRLTDADIRYIENKGSSELKRALDMKANKEYAEQKHLDRMYGKGEWTGRDNNGNPYKEMHIGMGHDSDIKY